MTHTNPVAGSGNWDVTLNQALDDIDNSHIPKTLLDAKGDLVAASSADTPARVAVGSNGQVLVADSAQAAGVKWATPSSFLGIGSSVLGYCTADTTRNNSTSLLDITGLSVSLVASATYVLDGWLAWTSNPTADIQFVWTVPSGATGLWSLAGPHTTSAPVVGSERINYIDSGAVSYSLGLNAAGDDEFTGTVFISARPAGYLTTTNAGTLTLRMAQNTANASNTTVKLGSWISLTRVA